MKVSAINGLTNSHINFEGKKRDNQGIQKPVHSSNPMKAVPVAVLIAMSPLNAPITNAQTDSVKPQTEIPMNNEKILSIVEYKNATPDGRTCQIRFISNDGNDDDIEKVNLMFPSKQYKSMTNNNGEKITVYQNKYALIETQALKKIIYKDKYGSQKDRIEYFVTGKADIFASPLINSETKAVVSSKEAINRKLENHDYRISTDFYNTLSELFGEQIPYLTEEYKIVF